MNIYLFSGLGADERALKFLTFPEVYTPIHVDWILPLKSETIGDYAMRISKVIDTSKPFALLGLSFGGIMVTEISQFLKAEKTILLSSVCNYTEIPLYLRFFGKLGIHKLAPKNAQTKANVITYWLFDTKTQKEKDLLKEIVSASSPIFTRWAIDTLSKWSRKPAKNDFIRIHGDKDRVLPITNFKPNYVIAGGGHFMVVNRAEEISGILAEVLKK